MVGSMRICTVFLKFKVWLIGEMCKDKMVCILNRVDNWVSTCRFLEVVGVKCRGQEDFGRMFEEGHGMAWSGAIYRDVGWDVLIWSKHLTLLSLEEIRNKS